MVVFVIQRTNRYSYYCCIYPVCTLYIPCIYPVFTLYLPRTASSAAAAVYPRLCSARFLPDERQIQFFDLIIRRAEPSDFGPKSDDLATGFSNQILSRRVLHYRIAEEDGFFFQIEEKVKNLKLGI